MDAAHAGGKRAAVVVVQLQVEVLRGGFRADGLRERLHVTRPLLVDLGGVQVRAIPARLGRAVGAGHRLAGVARLRGHVGRALPVGGVELDAGGAIELVLVRVEIVAGDGEAAAQIRLERGIAGLALALGGGVVQADVLAAHEHPVGLAIAVDVDAAIGVLHDVRGNRRTVPWGQKAAVAACACCVFAVQRHAVLVQALVGVGARGVGEIGRHQQAPATVVVVRNEAVGLRPPLARGPPALGVAGVAIGKAAGQIPGTIGVQIQRATDAAIGGAGGGRLDHVDAVEQRGRHHAEVRLLRVDLVGGDEHLAVEHGAHFRQAAHIHRGAHAGVAVDLHAGDALQRVGDGHVGQLADAFGGDAVLDVRGQALQLDRAHLRGAHAGDGDGRQRDGLPVLLVLRGSIFGFGALRIFGRRRRRGVLRRGSVRPRRLRLRARERRCHGWRHHRRKQGERYGQ